MQATLPFASGNSSAMYWLSCVDFPDPVFADEEQGALGLEVVDDLGALGVDGQGLLEPLHFDQEFSVSFDDVRGVLLDVLDFS